MSNDDKTIELITNLDRNAVERILQQVATPVAPLPATHRFNVMYTLPVAP